MNMPVHFGAKIPVTVIKPRIDRIGKPNRYDNEPRQTIIVAIYPGLKIEVARAERRRALTDAKLAARAAQQRWEAVNPDKQLEWKNVNSNEARKAANTKLRKYRETNANNFQDVWTALESAKNAVCSNNHRACESLGCKCR